MPAWIGILQRFTDPEGYETSRRIQIAVGILLGTLYMLWRMLVEVQFAVLAETTEGVVSGAGEVQYTNGEEFMTGRLSLPPGTAMGTPVEIDYLPGVNSCRIAGSHEWWPFILFLIGALVATVFLWQPIQEARAFANGTAKRRRRR